MKPNYNLYNLPEVDCEELAKDLLGRAFNIVLEPYIDSESGVSFDLYSKSNIDGIQVLVRVEPAHESDSISSEILIKYIVNDFDRFIPGKYILISFSEQAEDTYEKLVFPEPVRKRENFLFLGISWIKAQLSLYPEISAKYNIDISNEIEVKIDYNKIIEDFVQGRSFFNVKHLWGGNNKKDQLNRFINEGIWENELVDNNRKLVKDVKQGDVLFAKSMNHGVLQINALGIVTLNPYDGIKLFVKWININHVFVAGFETFRGAIDRIENGKETIILNELFSKQPNLSEKILEFGRKVSNEIEQKLDLNNDSTQFWWINASDEFWSIDDFKVGDIQSYMTHNEDKKKRKIFKHFFSVKKGDLCIGYQTEPVGKTKAIFEIIQEAKNEKGDEIRFKIIRKFKDNEQFKYAELKKLDYFSQSEVVVNNNQGSIFKLNKAEYYEIYSLLQLEILEDENKSSVKKTSLDNDGAYNTEDLLDIENDVRSFALILAAKDIKPPIAVALFGKWGSGKSFFMQHLYKRVNELSIHQGFLEELESSLDQDEEKKEDAFCKGIAQINFNAWSYLDANLWAGLVSTIFEKLNEYITESTKSGVAKLKVQGKLGERLKAFRDLKLTVEGKKNHLENLKQGYKQEAEKLENNIIQNIGKVILSVTESDLKLKNAYNGLFLDEEQFGENFTIQDTNLVSEYKYWVNFIRNIKKVPQLLRYGLWAIFGIALAATLIYFYNWNFSLYLGLPVVSVLTKAGIWWKTKKSKIKKYVDQFNVVIETNSVIKDKVEKLEAEIKFVDDQKKQAQEKIEDLENEIQKLN